MKLEPSKCYTLKKIDVNATDFALKAKIKKNKKNKARKS